MRFVLTVLIVVVILGGYVSLQDDASTSDSIEPNPAGQSEPAPGVTMPVPTRRVSKCVTPDGATHYGDDTSDLSCSSAEVIEVRTGPAAPGTIATAPKDRPAATRPPVPSYCDGRVYCSQMTSCAEAKRFLRSCPDTRMDGDGDGIPCEAQWCG